jgi:hypothetical protein
MRQAGMRVALYWAPEPADPLWQAGNSWLGRDPEHNTDVAQPPVPGIAAATQDARVYGFHATLRPPMRLATGWEEFLDAAHQLAERVAPFDLPALEVAELSGFLALRERLPCPALQLLAEMCVRATNAHRLPPSAAELEKRRKAGLSPAQEALLAAWGYPYVLDSWFFHMTLTRRLNEAEMRLLRPAAERHFAASLAVPRVVTHISIFTQRAAEADGAPAPFLICDRLKLRGRG